MLEARVHRREARERAGAAGDRCRQIGNRLARIDGRGGVAAIHPLLPVTRTDEARDRPACREVVEPGEGAGAVGDRCGQIDNRLARLDWDRAVLDLTNGVGVDGVIEDLLEAWRKAVISAPTAS